MLYEYITYIARNIQIFLAKREVYIYCLLMPNLRDETLYLQLNPSLIDFPFLMVDIAATY